jgi:hypothetical protein
MRRNISSSRKMWILDFFSEFSKRVGSKLLVYHIEWHHQEFPRFVLRLRAEPSRHTTSCTIHGHESHQHKYYPIREISRYRVVLSFYVLHLLLYAGCRAPQESFPRQRCSQARAEISRNTHWPCLSYDWIMLRSCESHQIMLEKNVAPAGSSTAAGVDWGWC